LGPLDSSYTVKIVGIEAEEEPFALSVYELPYIGAGLEAFPDRVDAEVQVGGTSVRRDPSVPIEVDIPVTLVFFGVLDETVVRHGPNPVPPEGCIFWLNLPDDAVEATLKIFDVDGALLVSIPLDPATDRYPETGRWIPQDSQGRLLGTGLYLYLVEILHADGPVTYSPVQKMVIQR